MQQSSAALSQLGYCWAAVPETALAEITAPVRFSGRICVEVRYYDGQMFNKLQFMEYYGGIEEWEFAGYIKYTSNEK